MAAATLTATGRVAVRLPVHADLLGGLLRHRHLRLHASSSESKRQSACSKTPVIMVAATGANVVVAVATTAGVAVKRNVGHLQRASQPSQEIFEAHPAPDLHVPPATIGATIAGSLP